MDGGCGVSAGSRLETEQLRKCIQRHVSEWQPLLAAGTPPLLGNCLVRVLLSHTLT